VTRGAWLAKHPYLEPIGRLDAEVEREIDGMALSTAGIPSWDGYRTDYAAGICLLESEAAAIDLAPIEQALGVLAGRLALRPLDGALLGLGRFLTWRLLSRYLGPVVSDFGRWRQEERWLRHYCPICGSPPAMAQLIGVDPGSLRLLVCGCCGNRWRYRRTGCPFCRTDDDHRLAAIAVEGLGGLRIDYCEQCRGYLKTYQGQGSEAVYLADWTSIQLDMIALDRGLKRVAASAYDLYGDRI
jgi:FdhE protein